MLVTILLDVPELYKPKAEFAMRTMFSAFFVKVDFWNLSDFQGKQEKALLYYGLNPEKYKKNAQVCILLKPETAAYFEVYSQLPDTNLSLSDKENKAIPVFFGDDEPSSEIIRKDIIASAFFLLSDWQRMIPGKRDRHGRVLFSESVQCRYDVAMRPLVNEYTCWLADQISQKTGYIFKNRTWNGHEFAGVITHDLDRIKKKYLGTVVRECFEIPILNALNLPLKDRWIRFKKSVSDLLKPEDGYEESIKKQFRFENEKKVRPTVLLKSIIKKHKNDARDYLGYPFFDEIINSVKDLEGEIGFHASYEAGYDMQLFEAELAQLEKKIRNKIRSHRFHFLRYDAKKGHEVLIKNNIKTDSSVAWAEQSGYRTGFTHPHFMFDIRNNRVSSLVQVPMMLMDMQLFSYMGLTAEEGVGIAKKQVDLAQKYGGLVVWNFHHHIYDKAEMSGGDFLFENSLNYLHSKKPTYLTMGDVYDTFYII